MAKFQLALLIHAHQPVGNFEDVLERAYAQSYLPFVEVLSRHPSIRLGLHYTGSLLEWIERAHPEYFERLRGLVKRGQIEIVGGGYYEPILIAIPLADRREQITRLANYVEKHFRGAAARRVARRTRLGTAAAFFARPRGRRIHTRGRQSFSRRGIRTGPDCSGTTLRGSVPLRQGSSRTEGAALPAAVSPVTETSDFLRRAAARTSWCLRRDGRRSRKVRRLARNPQALLHGRVAREFLPRAREKFGLARDFHSRRRRSLAPRRSAAPIFLLLRTPK